jgi:hypothetical protein
MYKILVIVTKVMLVMLISRYCGSLVPRPFFAGEEKMAWYTLLAHAHYSHKILGICARSLHLNVIFRCIYIAAY